MRIPARVRVRAPVCLLEITWKLSRINITSAREVVSYGGQRASEAIISRTAVVLCVIVGDAICRNYIQLIYVRVHVCVCVCVSVRMRSDLLTLLRYFL